MKFISNNAYKSSPSLPAKEKVILNYSIQINLNSNFIKQSIDSETIELIRKYKQKFGIFLSIQPTGNSSIYANNVSGGLNNILIRICENKYNPAIAPDQLDPAKHRLGK